MDKILEDFSNELRSTIQKSHDSFEKQLNYISAGALGISIVFIEKIVKDVSEAKCNSLLILSWLFFAATLISNLISHIYTSNIHDKTLSEINNDMYNEVITNKRNKKIKRWNLVSISLLFIGIIFHLVYITQNI